MLFGAILAAMADAFDSLRWRTTGWNGESVNESERVTHWQVDWSYYPDMGEGHPACVYARPVVIGFAEV